jgi:hypothetical protein
MSQYAKMIHKQAVSQQGMYNRLPKVVRNQIKRVASKKVRRLGTPKDDE